jgi:N2227-like protein
MNVLGAQIAGDGELPLIGRYATGSLLLAVAAFLMAVFLKLSLPEQSSPRTPPARTTIGLFPPPRTTTTSIPFLVIREPDWRIIPKTLEAYEKETHRALETLSLAIETLRGNHDEDAVTVAPVTDLLHDKIDRLEQLYANDMAILKDIIIKPFPCQFMLPLQSSLFVVAEEQEETTEEHHHATTSHPRHERQSQQFTFAAPRQQQTPDSSTTAAASSSYDSVRQVVAHLVRDWSELGAAIRTPLYDWCSSAITKHYNTVSSSSSGAAAGPILVPGAGLGRLAWQLAAVDGYLVEALESSTVMAAAAYAMYHYHGSKPRLTIHPYAADPFSNEVDSRQRYTSCRVPDINTTTTSDMIWSSGGRLSYTVATFDLEAIPHQHYGAVVTCFFLDTATTLVDYIVTIQAVLKNGGLWINVGPLQWHLNSKVPLVADELRVLLTNVYHFTVLHWSVDETVLNYRDASQSSGSTFSDGYRPLRFILRWD